MITSPPSPTAAVGRGRRRALPWLAALLLAACPGIGTSGGPAAAAELPGTGTPGIVTAAAVTESPPAALPSLLSTAASAPSEIDGAVLAALRRFYAGRDGVPLWIGPTGLTPPGQALRARLTRARSAGLPGLERLLPAIEARLREPQGSRAAELELLLSAALIEGAIDPADPAAPGPRPQILAQAAAAGDATALLHRALPADPAFWRLREALDAYRALAAAGGWTAPTPGPNLELDSVGPRVEVLRRRLQVTGDLAATGDRPDVFDAELDAAVRRFQARHGLLVDGIVGRRTQAALAVPIAQRLSTLRLNLVRLARQQRDWGDRYVAVNAAAAAYRLVEGGRPVLERAAVVGRPSWPTPQLESVIDQMEFNPYWNVPPNIARLEVLPKASRDPGYLERNEMRWVDGLLRQQPGPKNPLGRVKFLFPNPYSVYLHDTNARQLFASAERFRSHGCVRVADALDLARHLLKDDPQWPPERIEQVLEAGRPVRLALARTMPVHIVYDTAWVDDAGRVQFRDDVYGLDREIERADRSTPGGVQLGGLPQACPSQDPTP